MFKGYSNERAYYNAKIYALAHLIAGEDAKDFVNMKVRRIKENAVVNIFEGTNSTEGVSTLKDSEAKELYVDLLNSFKNVKANIPKGIEMMTDEQRKKIIKLTKYKFKWPVEVTFSKIIEFCPELSKRLTPWQIKQTKILPLFNQIKRLQADSIIKRLEKIEKRNA